MCRSFSLLLLLALLFVGKTILFFMFGSWNYILIDQRMIMLFSGLLFGDFEARVIKSRCLRSKLSACRNRFFYFYLFLLYAFVYVFLRNVIFFKFIILVLVIRMSFRVELRAPVIHWVRSSPVKVMLTFTCSEHFIILFVGLVVSCPARSLVLRLLGNEVIIIQIVVIIIVGCCLILGLFLVIRILLNFLMLSFSNRRMVSQILLLIWIFVVLFM